MTPGRTLWLSAGPVLAAAALGVVATQAVAFRVRRLLPADSAPPIGQAAGGGAGEPVRLGILGDSTATGVGVTDLADTVPARIADALGADGFRVSVVAAAVAGARVRDLAGQVSRVLANGAPDLVVILIGTNDATHLSRIARLERDVAAAVRRLRSADVVVVVGTCPDLGAARAIGRPLRDLVRRRGRRVANAEIRGVERAGGVAIDLAAQTGPVFCADPATLSKDLFHPSADGYRLWAAAMLPAIRHALGAPTMQQSAAS